MKHLKPISIIVLILILGMSIGYIFLRPHSSLENKTDTAAPTIFNNASIDSFEAHLFMPYWTFPDSLTDLKLPDLPNTSLTSYIYFGVSALSSGSINKNDPGFAALPGFVKLTGNQDKEKLLTIRMIDREVNEVILDSQEKQNSLINEAITIAENNDFDGLILDLEISNLPTQKLASQIAFFSEIAGRKLHAKQLTFGMTIFGDSFYRVRPYDMTELSKHVDQFYIMAYDLHKAGGNPGPNFPLTGREEYGYDFVSMVTDMRRTVADNQLTIVFGMYGYDWWVDDKRRAIRPAKALTLREIRETFLSDCVLQDCVSTRDEKSVETEINYVDDSAGFHVVWFEDEASVMTKTDHLGKQGIGSIGIWAAGYY